MPQPWGKKKGGGVEGEKAWTQSPELLSDTGTRDSQVGLLWLPVNEFNYAEDGAL